VKDRLDTFSFAAPARPSLINFDADKVLVAEKKDNKTLEEYLFQYRNAGNYIERREAIDAASRRQAEVTGVEIMKEALGDGYEPLRAYAINALDMKKEAIRAAVEPMLASIAQKEKTKLTRAAAISKLGELKSASYLPIYRAALNDSSYSVSGAALNALSAIDSLAAMSEARRLSAFPAKGRLRNAITSALIRGGDESAAATVLSNFEQMPLSQEKFETLRLLREYLERVKNPVMFKRGIDDIVAAEQQVPESFRGQVSGFITQVLTALQNLKTASGEKELADYVQQKLKIREEKKTF
jgi:aminopeptidase N